MQNLCDPLHFVILLLLKSGMCLIILDLLSNRLCWISDWRRYVVTRYVLFPIYWAAQICHSPMFKNWSKSKILCSNLLSSSEHFIFLSKYEFWRKNNVNILHDCILMKKISGQKISIYKFLKFESKYDCNPSHEVNMQE